jgi:cytochrome P450
VLNTTADEGLSGAEERGQIPVASGLPLIGSSLYLLANPLKFFLQQAKKHGPVYRVKAANRDMVILSGVEANRFMSEEGKDCFVSSGFWGNLVEEWQCPHFLSAIDGAEHIDERKALKSSFSRTVADSHQEGLVEVVHQTVGRYLRGDAVVPVRDLTRTLTNSELYYLLTGERLDLNPKIAQALSDYQRITFNVLVLGKWPRLALMTPYYLLCKRRSLRFVRDLRRRFEREPPAKGFFKVALDRHKAHPERKSTELDFAFLAPFWAGLDTLGASLVFLINQLVNDEALLLRVRDELDTAVLALDYEAIPEAAQLRKLPLLYGLCMEILRVYPVAFGNGRTAARDFSLHGYTVAKGQDLLVLTSATHFDPRYFPKPHTFDIERYGEGRQEHRTKYAFNPYGRGPHICLGAAMAESLMLTTVATLIYYYEFSAREPGKQYPMIFDPSPTMSRDFQVNMKARVTPAWA